MARNPNRMQEAVDTLAGVFKQNASILVNYQQGGVTLIGLSATVGSTPYDVMQGEVMTAYESRDYTFTTADLQGTVPKSGDVITEQVSGRRYVLSLPAGLNVYENFGPLDSATKVHTKALS